jgi:RNA polymerase sigma-70 factor (ECF subfamily)
VESDGELLERWSTGDTAAGRRLFERHYASVYRFFNTKVSGGLEDLVQDTFTACVASRDRLASASSFRGYLYGTARNILRQHFRKARVRGAVVDLDNHSVHDISPSPVSFVVEKAEHRLLIRGKEALRSIMEGLAASPELLESTLTNLEAWAAQVRDVAGPSA